MTRSLFLSLIVFTALASPTFGQDSPVELLPREEEFDPDALVPAIEPTDDEQVSERLSRDESYKNTLLFTKVTELIRREYVDEGKVSYKELIHSALKGMLSSLDPHSQFLDEDAFAEMRKETSREFSGLGLVVGTRDNQIIVIAPIEGTPGYEAGVLPGDRILKIGERSTENMTLGETVKLMEGRKGESLRLTLMRPNESGDKSVSRIFEVSLVRDTIVVKTVREARLLDAELTGDFNVGYVRLEQFGENTAEEFDEALLELKKKAIEALVIDLRNNPGGLLDAAVEVAGMFLPPGQIIVSTRGRTKAQSFDYAARGTSRHPNYPIAILINGYSASGSEIVAGALKDLGRGILVGERTFGKGSVQSVQNLGGGVGIRLTTAKYYTPSKRVIHEVGIEPDILAPISEAEERALIMLRSPQRLSEVRKEQLANVRDTQLERAVGALKGIRIFNQRKAALDKAPKP